MDELWELAICVLRFDYDGGGHHLKVWNESVQDSIIFGQMVMTQSHLGVRFSP